MSCMLTKQCFKDRKYEFNNMIKHLNDNSRLTFFLAKRDYFFEVFLSKENTKKVIIDQQSYSKSNLNIFFLKKISLIQSIL